MLYFVIIFGGHSAWMLSGVEASIGTHYQIKIPAFAGMT